MSTHFSKAGIRNGDGHKKRHLISLGGCKLKPRWNPTTHQTRTAQIKGWHCQTLAQTWSISDSHTPLAETKSHDATLKSYEMSYEAQTFIIARWATMVPRVLGDKETSYCQKAHTKCRSITLSEKSQVRETARGTAPFRRGSRSGRMYQQTASQRLPRAGSEEGWLAAQGPPGTVCGDGMFCKWTRLIKLTQGHIP